MTTTVPRSDIDLFTDEAILEPYENYRALRDAGPAVWLDRYNVFALPRYREVFEVLRDHKTFSSASGTGLTNEINQLLQGNTLASDPPEHDRIRAVTGPPLTPRALREFRDDITSRADELVGQLIDKGSFDAVTDFAQVFPTSLVPDMIGWPAEERENLLKWASAGFNAIGPLNDRTLACLPALQEMDAFVQKLVREENLSPDGWGDRLLKKGRKGEVPEGLLPALLIDYLAPSLDTTISALGTAVWAFGNHPEQWDMIRENPKLIPAAVSEVVRFESPIRGFARRATRDTTLDGVPIERDQWVFILYASANRDERHWEDPERFDITRDATGHVGFGYGVHRCMGQPLARLEIEALLTSLAARVTRLEVGEPEWALNNIIRAIGALPVTLHA